MATFLDIGFMEHFSSIFIVLFIFVLVYAVLSFKGDKIFGTNKGVIALFSFAVAMVFLMSEDAQQIVRTSIPWFVIIVIALVFMVIGKEAFGAIWSPELPQTIGTWVYILAIIIMLFSISNVLGQKAGPYLGDDSNSTTSSSSSSSSSSSGSVATDSFQDNLGATLFHPKVLGLILIMVIALFVAMWIGGKGPGL